MKAKTFYSLFLLVSFVVSFAQVSVNTSGGNTSNASNSVSYSIGQPFYHQISSSSGVLTEGVQQPFEIITLGTVYYMGIQLGIKIYPNPTTSLLFLKIEGISLENLNFRLFDSAGRIIHQGKIKQTETSIDMHAKPSGVYILNVSDSQKNIQSFKIIKN